MYQVNKQLHAIFTVCSLLLLSTPITAQNNPNLEERVSNLEEQIELILEILENQNNQDSETIPSESPGKTDEPILEAQLPIRTKIVELSYNESDESNNWENDYKDWISMKFQFTNNLDKTIRAAKGSIVFMDLFGDEWWSVGLSVNNPIPSNESLIWEGSINYNSFDAGRQEAKYKKPSDVLVRFDVAKILFSDGTQIELNQ